MSQPEQGGGRRPERGRLARHWRTAREIGEDPASIPQRLRELLLKIWCSRGGGFYGLGYLIAFVYFEIDMLLGDVGESEGAGDFMLGQLGEYLFRLGFLSFINVFRALLWPLMVAGWWDGLGLALLLAGYLAFEWLLKPVVDRQFPELGEHREGRLRAKADKREARRSRRRERRARWRKRQPASREGRVE